MTGRRWPVPQPGGLAETAPGPLAGHTCTRGGGTRRTGSERPGRGGGAAPWAPASLEAPEAVPCP
eukprot:14666756-Alexandrium_andersonii.AAC.1